MDTPKVGDIVYIQGACYTSHGADDIAGGKATIQAVVKEYGKTYITLKEVPSRRYCWEWLEELQEYLKEQYGQEWARPDPDLDPESNDAFGCRFGG